MDSSAIIEQMNRESRGTLMASLGIEFTGIGENWLEAKMPIDERTRSLFIKVIVHTW